MQPPDRTPEGWSAVAVEYDEGVTPFTAPYATDALRVTNLRAGERVLDIATGGGALALQAARLGADVLATDFAPRMVERVRDRAHAEGLRVRADVMDAGALTAPDDAFDAAYCVFGAMFFPERVQAFGEMRRVLRPEGRAAVVTWGPGEKSALFSALLKGVAEVAPDVAENAQPPAALSLADPKLIEHDMMEAGFRDVRVQQVEHDAEFATPEDAWNALTRTNPVFPVLVTKVGEARVPRLREAVIRNLQPSTSADGTVRARAEGNLAVAQK